MRVVPTPVRCPYRWMISRDADYGVRVAVDLALHGKSVRAKVAKRQGIPEGCMPRVTRALRGAGIVSAMPGRGGGLALAQDPSVITLLDVVVATHGGVALNCCLLQPSECDRNGYCPAYPFWRGVQERLNEDLAAVSIADIAGVPAAVAIAGS